MRAAELHHAHDGPRPISSPIDRQVCVLTPEDWAHWLFLSKLQEELLWPFRPARSMPTVREGG
jgi:putative SOS response-associated peptidase YedK